MRIKSSFIKLLKKILLPIIQINFVKKRLLSIIRIIFVYHINSGKELSWKNFFVKLTAKLISQKCYEDIKIISNINLSSIQLSETSHQKSQSWVGSFEDALIYATNAMFSYFNKASCDEMIMHIPNSVKHILDAGAGTGALSLQCARRGFFVDAVDISSQQLAVLNFLKGKLPITTYQCNLFEIERIEKTYDLVISRWVVSHFNEQLQLLRSFVKVLKKEGYIIYDMDNQENIDYAFSIAPFDTLITGYSRSISHRDYYKASSQAELESLAREVGCDLIARIPILFLLNNNIFAACLQKSYGDYKNNIFKYIKNKSVANFISYFSTNIVSKLPPELTFRSIIIMQKK